MRINYGTWYTYWDRKPNGLRRTKSDVKDLTRFWNNHARHAANMEAARVVIDETTYFIDVKENFIGKIGGD